ncbi:MAG: UDP-N-acetylmuramoyl-tripeptide--D-alanyl-D-alanine ligase [Kiritimatiellia bacterium]
MDPVSPNLAAAWCRGQWHARRPSEPLRALAVDSRRAGAGDLFFALKGEKADGHDFLSAVASAGACAVVRADFPVNRLPAGGGFLRVDDVLAALGRFAAGYRATLPARLVGVTGSVGKTSTKELVADLLATVGKTARTAGNFNNEIGLPLSLAGVGGDCAFGVIEAGISHPGEMAPLRDVLMPDVAVMTAIGPVHAEFFESVRAIAEEKAALLEKLPASGFAVLDLDDDYFEVLRGHSSAPVATCSLKRREADYAGDPQADGTLWVCERATGERAALPLPPPGGYMAQNALWAVAVARKCGAEWGAIETALRNFRPVGMRWAVEDVGGWRAVNDGYNANPVSMQAALRAFADWPVAGRKFLALGPMLELGRREKAEHEALGRFAAAGRWSGVAVVSRHSEDAAAQAVANGFRDGGGGADRLFAAPGPDEAAAWLRERLRPGDALLLKASRGVRIERVLDELKKES